MKRLLMTSAAVLATVAFASAQPASEMTKPGPGASAQTKQSTAERGSPSNEATVGQRQDHGEKAHQNAEPSKGATEEAKEKSRNSSRSTAEREGATAAGARQADEKTRAQQGANAPKGQESERGANTRASEPSAQEAQQKSPETIRRGDEAQTKGPNAQHPDQKQRSENAKASGGTNQESAAGTAPDRKDKTGRSAETGANGQGQGTSDERQNSPQNSAQGAPGQSNQNANGQNSARSENTTATGQVQGANLSTEQRTRIEQTVFARSDVPRVSNVNFAINVGVEVPSQVHLVEVPTTLVEIYPEWRGCSYFVANDQIVIVQPSRRIVAVIPAGHNASSGARADAGDHSYSETQIREIQQVLKSRGFYEGEIDGVMGPRTKEAVTAFQRKQGLQATGEIDTNTVSALGVNLSSTSGGISNKGVAERQSGSDQQGPTSGGASDRTGGAADTRKGAAQEKPTNPDSNQAGVKQDQNKTTAAEWDQGGTSRSPSSGKDAETRAERGPSITR